MSSVPAWLQVTAHFVAIVAGLGGIFFALLVLWPSIRQSNRTAKKISDALDRAEKKGVENLLKDL